MIMKDVLSYFKGNILAKATLWLFFLTGFSVKAEAQALQLVWGNSMHGKSQEWISGVALDTVGNVYLTGIFRDTFDLNPGQGNAILVPKTIDNSEPEMNVFIAKYDTAGNFLWAKTIIGRHVESNPGGNSITVDAMGNLIMVGSFKDSADFDPGPGSSILESNGGQDIYIMKLDQGGNFLWAKSFGGLVTEWACEVNVDALGNIYLSGSFSDTVDFDPGPGTEFLVSAGGQDNFVAKYDKDGNYLWAHRMGSPGNTVAENGAGLAVDKDGNVISTGRYGITATFSSTNTTLTSISAGDVYVMKHDSTGNFSWAISFGGAGWDDYGYDVVVDKLGNIYTVGYFNGQVDFDPGPDTAILTANYFDGFVAKYDPDGNYLWAINIGGTGYLNLFTNVGIDAIGNVYVTGNYSGTADFDPGPGTANLTAASGEIEGFVAKYDGNTGAYLWAGALESSISGYTGAFSVAPDGTLYVSGGFRGTIDLDPGPGVEQRMSVVNSNNDMFLIKLSCGENVTTRLNEVVCDSSFSLNGEIFTSSGTYIQHLPGASHCDSLIVLDLTIDPMEPPVITINGFILATTQQYASYQWIKDGVPMPGETNSTLLVTENGDYQIRVWNNEDGCVALSVIYPVNNVDIKRPDIASKIQVYPNPTRDQLTFISPIDINVDLLSIEGRHLQSVREAVTLSLKGMAEGVYLLRISNSRGQVLKFEKVVKQP